MQDFTGQQIDRYRITESLGMGGMAIVYKAYDTRLERDVAIKFIRIGEIPESQHDRIRKRFEQEARTQASFSHPNIVPAHDYGEFDDTPYLVLGYLPGGTLKERIKDGMTLTESFGIIIPIVDAVAYAHSKRVLHRDIKPSNIIFNEKGIPMLTDFGIAKLLETTEATLTGTGLGVGTPEYMAPEQWRGEAGEASDQYALGVVLYEMLTGEKPFTAETPMAVALRQLHEPLPRPSALNPEIPEDLERILFKALAREARDRFGNMKIFHQRLLALKLGSPLVEAQTAAIREKTVLKSKIKVERLDDQQTFDSFKSKSFVGREEKLLQWQDRKRQKFPKWLSWVGIVLLGVVLVTYLLGGVMDGFSSLSIGNQNMDSVPELTPVRNIPNESEDPVLVDRVNLQKEKESFDEDEKIETYDNNGNLISNEMPLFSTEKITKDNVRLVKELGRFGKGTIRSVALSPDGTKLSVAGGIGIHLYDYDSLEQILYINTGYSVTNIAFSPGGEVLASDNENGVIALWNVVSGALLRNLEGHSDWINQIVFSPDGGLVVSASEDQTVILWDVISGSIVNVLEGNLYRVTSLSFSPDGLSLAAGDDDGIIYVWDIKTGELIRTIDANCGGIYSIVFSQDGKSIVSGCNIGVISFWDVSSGNQTKKFVGDNSSVMKLALSPDGAFLGAGNKTGTITLWNIDSGIVREAFLGHSSSVNGLTFSPDGAKLISGSTDGTVRIWDVSSGLQLQSLGGHISLITDVSFSLANNFVSLGSHDGRIFTWDLATGRQVVLVVGQPDWVSCIAFSPDGSLLASGSRDGTVRLWEAGTGMQIGILEGHTGEVLSVSFSPDGAVLASGGGDGALRVWDVDSQRLLNTFGSGGNAVYSIGFSPDGAIIASGSNFFTVDLWDVSNGERFQTIEGSLSIISGLAFTTNKDVLAVSGMHYPSYQMEAVNAINLYDTKSGELVNKLEGEGYYSVSSVSFTPDGTILASGSDDGIIRLWDVQSGELIMSLEGHLDEVIRVEFFSEGTMLESGSSDGTVRLWGIP